MNQNFWQRNKVFLTGLAAALALALTEFTVQPTVDWKVVGYAALMAVLSYAANTWRGQGVTILGVLGTLAGTFVSLQTTGHFTWAQFFISAVAAVLAAVASPPKPLGYEKTSTIENAKAQGRQMSKVIILLIGLSLAMSSATHAQSFFKALPKESAKYGAAAPGGTLNLFRPSINLVSYSVPGNRLMTGAGPAYEHLKWDATSQKWDVVWSINAQIWYFAPLASGSPTNGNVAYGLSAGVFNNLVLVGVATDGHYTFGTVGIGVNLNN
jgi:hypothetical protein